VANAEGQEKGRREPAAPAGGKEDPDARKGAVEGDRPDDPQHFNANVPALDDHGLPADEQKICEDVLGANADDTQG